MYPHNWAYETGPKQPCDPARFGQNRNLGGAAYNRVSSSAVGLIYLVVTHVKGLQMHTMPLTLRIGNMTLRPQL